MQTIVIFCEENKNGLSLYKALASQKNFKVQLFDSFAVVEKAMSGKINCFVYDTHHLNSNVSKHIDILRKYDPQLPVLVTPASADATVAGALRSMRWVYVFERPFKDKELLKVVQKVVTGKDVYQRAYKRYATQQFVIIDDVLRDRKIEGQIQNMSKGGALIECATGDLKMNDILKLSIELRELEKSHLVYGEVVWAADLDGKPGRVSVGIRFINQDDAANLIIEKRRGSSGQ